MACRYGCNLRGPDPDVVDTRPRRRRVLDTQLAAMEYHRLRLAALPGSLKHLARFALVSLADLALRLAGSVALAFVADIAAHVDTLDVCRNAAGYHGVPG